jgi:hypothetical protein
MQLLDKFEGSFGPNCLFYFILLYPPSYTKGGILMKQVKLYRSLASAFNAPVPVLNGPSFIKMRVGFICRRGF